MNSAILESFLSIMKYIYYLLTPCIQSKHIMVFRSDREGEMDMNSNSLMRADSTEALMMGAEDFLTPMTAGNSASFERARNNQARMDRSVSNHQGSSGEIQVFDQCKCKT